MIKVHIYKNRNPDFKLIEFDKFKKDAGSNAYVFSLKEWTAVLGAIGLLAKSGRYGGGIYAHIDIAFEFASWIYTDAIRDNLIPPELTPEQVTYKYVNEADFLNVALFDRTAKQWWDSNLGK